MTKIRGRVKELWLDFLYDIAGGFLQAVALHCFIDSIDIAPGGATGLAILLNRFTSLPIGILTFAVNVPLLIAAWIYLGKGRTIKTLKTVAVLTVILDFIITPYVPVYTGDKMVSCIFGGVLMGASLAVVFMRGSTTEVPAPYADGDGSDADGYGDHRRIHGGVRKYRIRSLRPY